MNTPTPTRSNRDALKAACDLPAILTAQAGGEPTRRRWAHPSHGDRTGGNSPASVSADRWKCWSCGEGGTVNDLLVAFLGMSVREATLALAEIAGVRLSPHRRGASALMLRTQLPRPVVLPGVCKPASQDTHKQADHQGAKVASP